MDAENDVTFVTMPWTNANYPGVSMILPDVDELLEILNDGFNPYQDEIQASDLSVLYRNSDGSYGVTSGTLLDSSLSRPRSNGSSSGSSGSSSSQTPDVPATEEPVENPDGSQTTDPSGSGEVTNSGGTGEIPTAPRPETPAAGPEKIRTALSPPTPPVPAGPPTPAKARAGGRRTPEVARAAPRIPLTPPVLRAAAGAAPAQGAGRLFPPPRTFRAAQPPRRRGLKAA